MHWCSSSMCAQVLSRHHSGKKVSSHSSVRFCLKRTAFVWSKQLKWYTSKWFLNFTSSAYFAATDNWRFILAEESLHCAVPLNCLGIAGGLGKVPGKSTPISCLLPPGWNVYLSWGQIITPRMLNATTYFVYGYGYCNHTVSLIPIKI